MRQAKSYAWADCWIQYDLTLLNVNIDAVQ